MIAAFGIGLKLPSLKRLWEIFFIHSFASLGVFNGNGEGCNNCQLCNSRGLCLSEASNFESWILPGYGAEISSSLGVDQSRFALS